MGLATLWILLLHSTAWFSSFLPGYIKATGYCGVDLFLILSAVGIWFSFQNHDSDAVSFLKRRALRILPAYWLIVLLRCIMEQTGIQYFVLLAGTLSFWILDDLSMWFIAGILWLYFLAPFLAETMHQKHWKCWYLGFFLAAFVIGVMGRNIPQNLLFARIPAFLLGFPVGRLVYDKHTCSTKEKLILLFCFAAGSALLLMKHRGVFDARPFFAWAVSYYSVLLFGVPLMLGAAWLFEKLSSAKGNVITQGLSFIGNISLEMYLWFEVLLRFFKGTFLEKLPIEYHGVVYSLLIAALTVLCAWLTHLAVAKTMKVLAERIPAKQHV